MSNQVEYGIRINVDGDRAAAAAFDEVTTSTDKLDATAQRIGQTLGAVNGQMNDTAVIMRQNAEATNSASEAAQKFLAPLQREIDLFGASRSETERYNAAKAGLTGTTQRQAAALGAALDAMQREEQESRAFAAEQDRATRAADAFLKKLNEQVATLGMNAQQLQTYRAAQLGVTDAAAPMIAKLGEAGAGAGAAGKHMEGFNFQTVAAKRELLVLAHEMSQGNFQKFGGSLMVLGEQTGVASLLFSAAGLAALGLTAILGGLAYAAIKGSLDQKHMNDALVMTGNYAGLTSDSLNALAHSAVEAGGSIGEAKKVATELAGSGKFTGDQIGYITSATVAWEHATGQSVKSIIKDFESLAVQTTGNSMRATEAISRATVKLDDQYHFLTEAVYEQIRALEKEGDAKGASAVATETFARVTHDRAEEILHNLGSIARGWNTIKETIGEVVDALGEFGKRSTPAIEVKKSSTKLQQFDAEVTASNRRLGRPDDQLNEGLAAGRLKIVLELTDAVDKLNKVDAAANAEGKKRVADSEAVHAASRIAADDVRLQKKNLGELQVALDQYADDVAKIKAVNPSSVLVTDDAVAQHIAAITKAHQANVKGNDDRAKTLQDGIVLEQTALEREKSVYDSREKMLALYHSKFGMSDAEFYAGRQVARAEYIASEAITFAKEAALVQGYRPKNAEEVAANKAKYDQLLKQHLKFVDDMRNAGGDDSATAAAAAKKSYDDIVKATHDAGVADIKRLDDAITKQKEHNAEIGKTKEQIELARQAAVDLDTAQLQSDADFIRGAMDKAGFDAQAMAVYAIRLNDLDEEIKRRKTLSGLLAQGADLEAGSKAAKDLDKFLDPTKAHAFGDSLKAAFGTAGDSIYKLITALDSFGAKQAEIDKQRSNAALAYRNGQKSEKDYLASIDELNRKAAQNQVAEYAGMADAAQSFFDQGSKGYAAMHAASQVLHAAEVALSLVKGVNAVLTQGGGDPYSAFGRMAAMAAIVVGLGVALGGGGSGGGQSAADVQKTQGTGAVFGDSSAKSASIAHSVALAAANSSIELTHTAGMLSALNSIEASMSGLTNLIVRTPGMTDASNMNIQEGTLSKSNISWTAAILTSGIFAPITKLLGSLWGKTTQNVVDSGLQFGGSVRDLEAGNGYNQYASVDTTKSSWFGLSKSTSNSVQTQGISNELSSQFGLIFTGVEASLKVAAVSLGVGADQVTRALDSLTIDKTKISLKGLTGDALTEAINGVISKTMDQMAQAAFPNLDSFRKVGEGYAETVVRVATDYANLDSILQASGMTFGAVGLSSLAAREKLIELAGGIDTLASKSNSFVSNFLSQAEQLAPVTKYVTEEMAKLGLANVTTREQFKDVVLGIDKTTAAGQAEYVALMNLADAFAKTHAATVDLSKTQQEISDERKGLQDQIDQLTLTSTQLREKERQSIDATNLALFDQVTQRQNVKATTDALSTMFDTLKSNRAGILSFSDSLKLGTLSTLTPMQKYLESERQYAESLAKARANPADSAAVSAEQTAATAFLTASQVINASSAAFVGDRARVLSDQTNLADIAGTQMTDAQRQLALAGQQVTGLTTLNATALGIQQAIVDLGTTGAVAAPIFDAERYSAAANAGGDAMAAEIKLLRAQVADLIKVVERRSADAERQKDEVADAIEKAGQATAEELGNAVQKVRWEDGNPGRRASR